MSSEIDTLSPTSRFPEPSVWLNFHVEVRALDDADGLETHARVAPRVLVDARDDDLQLHLAR
jgi:hypothetical protein